MEKSTQFLFPNNLFPEVQALKQILGQIMHEINKVTYLSFVSVYKFAS